MEGVEGVEGGEGEGPGVTERTSTADASRVNAREGALISIHLVPQGQSKFKFKIWGLLLRFNPHCTPSDNRDRVPRDGALDGLREPTAQTRHNREAVDDCRQDVHYNLYETLPIFMHITATRRLFRQSGKAVIKRI